MAKLKEIDKLLLQTINSFLDSQEWEFIHSTPHWSLPHTYNTIGTTQNDLYLFISRNKINTVQVGIYKYISREDIKKYILSKRKIAA